MKDENLMNPGANPSSTLPASSFILHPSSFPLSAVLLAGGRSSRMGRDKALLPLPDGRPLWRRQWDDVLRPLCATEMFFSGPPRAGLSDGVTVLADAAPDLGPLAGIAAALDAMRTPLLVVLAVDLPGMTAGFLRGRLLPRCAPGRGAVPRAGDGFYEPLAAIYPRECLPLAVAQLEGSDRSMQTFVRTAESAGLVEAMRIDETDAPLFVNWNQPTDL